MKSLERIRDTICSELDEMSVKPRFDRNDVDLVAKMVDVVKDIDTIDAMEEGGYSYEGEPTTNTSYRRSGRSYDGNYDSSYRSRRSRTGDMMYDDRMMR